MNRTSLAQQTKTESFLPQAHGLLQRKSACGNHTSAGKESSECSKDGETSLQRPAVRNQSVNGVSPIVPTVHQYDTDGIRVGKSKKEDGLSAVSLSGESLAYYSDYPRQIPIWLPIDIHEGRRTSTMDKVISSLQPGRPLSTQMQESIQPLSSHPLDNVRVHDDYRSRTTADLLNS